jgi:hypothetical protein
MLILPMLLGAFRPPKTDNKCEYLLAFKAEQALAAIDRSETFPTSKFLVLSPREKPWPASVVEKLRAAWVN